MAYNINDFPKHIRDQVLTRELKRAVSPDKRKSQNSPVALANVTDDTQCMNKTESLFYAYLQASADIVHVDFNSWRCKLATTQAKDAWYKPDFFVIRDTGKVEIYEVKGFWRSRDRVRIKVAASIYPYFNWYGAQFEKGEWKFERF